jgi:putative copper export protein
MNDFAEWLSGTQPSIFIQSHEAWMIPVLQSVHIIGIGIVVGSVMMMALRVLGRINMDQSLLQNQRRFGPWLTGALSVMLATGGLLVRAR